MACYDFYIVNRRWDFLRIHDAECVDDQRAEAYARAFFRTISEDPESIEIWLGPRLVRRLTRAHRSTPSSPVAALRGTASTRRALASTWLGEAGAAGLSYPRRDQATQRVRRRKYGEQIGGRRQR